MCPLRRSLASLGAPVGAAAAMILGSMLMRIAAGGAKAVVVPRPPTPPLHAEGELQLFGGNTDSGRLGVYHRGKWGAICSDEWGMAEAAVACRELGFESPFMAMAMPGPEELPVWMSAVRCRGDEGSLLQCRHRLPFGHPGTCTQKDAVGIACLAHGLSAPPDRRHHPRLSAIGERSQATAAFIQRSIELDEAQAAAEVAEKGAHAGAHHSSTACAVAAEVPMPFSAEAFRAAYVFGAQLMAFVGRRDSIARNWLCGGGNSGGSDGGFSSSGGGGEGGGSGLDLQRRLVAWRRRGLRVNSFGVDPSALLAGGSTVPQWSPGVPCTARGPPPRPDRGVQAATAAAPGRGHHRQQQLWQDLRRVYLGGDGERWLLLGWLSWVAAACVTCAPR